LRRYNKGTRRSKLGGGKSMFAIGTPEQVVKEVDVDSERLRAGPVHASTSRLTLSRSFH